MIGKTGSAFAARLGRIVAGVAAPCLAITLSATAARAEDAQKNSDVGIDPYYTGSLIAPSPAVPKAGLYAFEPYVIQTLNPGRYGVRGGLSPVSDATSTTSTLTLMKYGITDHLSIELEPQSQINSADDGFNSGSQAGDLPIELEYRFIDQDKKTGKPSITFSAGANVPTGRYQNLYAGADGQGAGTYRARLGLLAQSLVFGQSQHPIRIRAYVTGAVPLGSVAVNNISSFGTGFGFVGRGTTGLSGTFGAAVEYSITQRLVFANDIFYAVGRSNNAFGFQGGTAVSIRSGSFDNLQLAPAFEYSFNDVFGIIAGVAFSVEGHNSSEIVQPQIAFNFVLDSTKPLGGIPALFKDLPGSEAIVKY